MVDREPYGEPVANVLQLRVSLDHFEPVIWRRVLVPDSIALPKLHRVLQELMLWWNYHLHTFTIKGVEYGEPEMDDFGDFNWRNVRGVKIASLLDPGESFGYNYDFGDNWELTIELEKVLPVRHALKHCVCVEGQYSAPPEDVGGIGGFQQFLETLADPTDEEHDHCVEWSGGHYDFRRFDVAEINAWLQQVH
jgi:hypothetical protein